MAAAADLTTEFAGRRWPLFGLALKTSVLTVLTLGVYRFWMKTRLRRYYWSSVRPGGVPLEYAGLPLEKLLGFLIAVVFLAFYIGIVNLILMFASFAILHGNVLAYALSFVGIVPVIFLAQYRARRYILARTRWRGLRFGLEPGAWGYAWRALGHWLVTILTLGLLWPRMTFWLEKYRTDRTFYGNRRFRQGGSWRMLWPKIGHIVFGLALCAGSLVAADIRPAAALGLIPGLPWLVFGWVYWRVHAFRLLTDHKTLGDVGFRAAPRTGRVFRIYLFGGILMVLSLILALSLLTTGLAALIGVLMGADLMADPVALVEAMPRWLKVSAGLLVYFAVFVFLGVLRHVFITLPRIRHYAETLTVTGAPGLSAIRQRGRDGFPEAEGFAEALDVGAAL